MLLRYFRRVRLLKERGWYKNLRGGYTQSHCMNTISRRDLVFASNKKFMECLGQYTYREGGVYNFGGNLFIYLKREESGKDLWLKIYCDYEEFVKSPKAWCELGDLVRHNADFGHYFKKMRYTMGNGYVKEYLLSIGEWDS